MKYTILSFVLLPIIGCLAVAVGSLMLVLLFFMLLMLLPLISSWEYKREVNNAKS